MKKSTILLSLAVIIAAVAFTGCFNQTVDVPDLTRSTLDNAKISLEKKGLLIYVVEKVESDDIEEGLICNQDPLAQSQVKRGSTIKVWISKGSVSVPVPKLENMSLNETISKLAQLGLFANVEYEYSSEVDKDMVISVDPMPGTRVEKNTGVKVKVSLGEEPAKTAVVPKATFMSKSSAEAKIKEAGLEPKFVYKVSVDYYEGNLYYQTPKAGSVVPVGSTVTVYIATVMD